MELLQLKYFITVAQYENMTKAADALHVAQPALSKTIARLEASLGVDLFERSGRKIRLNAFGKAYLGYVQKALANLEKGKREIMECIDGGSGSVYFASNLNYILTQGGARYLTEHPNISYHYQYRSLEWIKYQLENGSIDFAISDAPLESGTIEWRHILEEEIFLLCGKAHRFHGRSGVELAEAAGELFTVSNLEAKTHQYVRDSYCRRHGFVPNVRFELPDSFVPELLSRTNSISFISKLEAVNMKDKLQLLELSLVRIVNPRCTRPIGICVNKESPPTKYARTFIEYVVNNMRGSNCEQVNEG